MGSPQGRLRAVGQVGVLVAVTAIVVLVPPRRAAAEPPPFVFTADHPAPAVAPTGRVFAAGATTPDGSQSVLVGGQLPESTPFQDTWTYATATGWTPRCGTTSPATPACPVGPHVAGGAATVPGGVLLYGGFPAELGDGSAALDDAWVWDGAAWQPVCDGCPPGGRGLFAMAGNGPVAVLYGGIGPGGALADTWLFDGTSWTNPCGPSAAVPCGPPPLLGASMAWDGTRFVLFGGAEPGPTTSPPVDDTWTFDGTAWTKACGTSSGGTPCGPPARGLAAFAHVPNPDPALSGALLAQGGDVFDDASQAILRDAWFWHDGAWSALTAPWSGPPVTWSGGSGPPPGDWPLLGTAMARPAECQVLYSAAGVTAFGFQPFTYLGGRDLTGAGTPSACTAPTPPTTAPVEPGNVAAGTASTGAIAKTGPYDAARTFAIALLCVALGCACIAIRRHFHGEPPHHL